MQYYTNIEPYYDSVSKQSNWQPDFVYAIHKVDR